MKTSSLLNRFASAVRSLASRKSEGRTGAPRARFDLESLGDRIVPATFHWAPVGASTDGGDWNNFSELNSHTPGAADTLILTGATSTNDCRFYSNIGTIQADTAYTGTVSSQAAADVVVAGKITLPSGILNSRGYQWDINGTGSSLGDSSHTATVTGEGILNFWGTLDVNSVIFSGQLNVNGDGTLTSATSTGALTADRLEVGVLSTLTVASGGAYNDSLHSGIYYSPLVVYGALDVVNDLTCNAYLNVNSGGNVYFRHGTASTFGHIGDGANSINSAGNVYLYGADVYVSSKFLSSGKVAVDRATGVTGVVTSTIHGNLFLGGASGSPAALRFESGTDDALSVTAALLFDNYSGIYSQLNVSTGAINSVVCDTLTINSTSTTLGLQAVTGILPAVTTSWEVIVSSHARTGTFSGTSVFSTGMTPYYDTEDVWITFTPVGEGGGG